MEGEDALVVACGPSATPDALVQTGPGLWESVSSLCRKHWTLSCNRSIPRVATDFGVVFEPGRDSVWEDVKRRPPMMTFGHHARGCPRKVEVISRDVSKWLPEADHEGRSLRLGQCPFWAAGIALWMGFETVGLIGVDITPDRFNNKAHLFEVEEAWGRLAKLAEKMDRKLVNLNPETYLKAVPLGKGSDIRPKRREP